MVQSYVILQDLTEHDTYAVTGPPCFYCSEQKHPSKTQVKTQQDEGVNSHERLRKCCYFDNMSVALRI